jgi:zinc protease
MSKARHLPARLLGLAFALMPAAGEPTSARAQAAVARPASPDSLAIPSLPALRTVLANGLTVIVSPDTSAPVVSVTLWYHVGSKNEVPGRTGFAHLFEHAMFGGSEHVPKGDHIKIVEDAGGTINGSTTNDRTNYFETVPINYLETVLWLEADRMGTLSSALTQEKLDNQRDVVKNERRYRVDNQVYGRAGEVIAAALLPPTNPYSWPVIGSMTDLSAASLDDVKQFFRTYYAPGNVVLVISGDIDAPRADSLVERYFGRIPPGPEIKRPVVQPETMATGRRIVLQDPTATLPRLAITWPTVGVRSPDAAPLSALADILTQDRTSRLTKLLVYDRQLATSVSAGNQAYEDAGSFGINVNPRPGVSLTVIEQLVDSVLGTVIQAPPAQAELQRTKSYAVVGTITALEPTDSRAETLAEGQTFFGDPLHYLIELRESEAVTPDDIQRVARKYLTAGRVVLSMVPSGKLDLISKPSETYTDATEAADKRPGSAP